MYIIIYTYNWNVYVFYILLNLPKNIYIKNNIHAQHWHKPEIETDIKNWHESLVVITLHTTIQVLLQVAPYTIHTKYNTGSNFCMISYFPMDIWYDF